MATFPLKPAGAKTVGVTYKLARLPAVVAAAVETVAPLPAGLALAWFSDTLGTFSEVSEAAYLMPEPDTAAGPVLGVAGFSGDIGGATVTWSTEWTPETGDGGDPGITTDGARLIVWPQVGTQPGVLLVSASINGVVYGPVAITVLRYAGDYTAAPIVVDPLTWSTGLTDETTTADAYYGFSAAVAGSWPAGTVFDWAVDDNIDITVITNNSALVVACNGSGDYGSLSATVTITAPTGDPVILGPITLSVYTY